MFSKGNNMFQQKVKAESEAIKQLLGFVPPKIEELRKEMDTYVDSQKEEYEEWDEGLQKYVVRVWLPSIDTSIVDDMLDLFYSSVVGRIYSFAENGLRILSGLTSKPKSPKGLPALCDLDLYYQEIINKYSITLPSIEVLWPDKVVFHKMRKEITHKGKCHLTETEKAGLQTNVENVLKMLLFVEEQIRTKSSSTESVI